MENKVLVVLKVPELDESYDFMIPVSRKVGNVIELLADFIKEETNGEYEIDPHKNLYNHETGERYNNNMVVIDTNIRNGTNLILI